MNDRNFEKNTELGVDLQRVFSALLRKVWFIVLVTVICAAVTLAITVLFVTPQYESSAMFYVNNNSLSVGDTSFSISAGDISASKDLVDSYIVILKSRTSLNDVIDYAGVDRTYDELKDMITASAVNSTEIFEVVVTSPDPVEAERIANAIAYILPKRISSIIEGTSAEIVDSAVVASSPSSPSYTINTMVGFLVGLILAIGIVVLREIFDITIKTEDDIAQICKHPVLAAVPDMTAPSKGGYYYASGKKKNSQSGKTANGTLLGGNISFAAAEAYKLLRTKLQFSFADEKKCRVVGISSALTGEGKSLSAINLAYTISQLDKRVLLIDCDMRRPSLASKLTIEKSPGLSNYLTGQNNLDTIIQPCGLKGEETVFHVISAGNTPPNPVELLSSARMLTMLKFLRDYYDYVILDLPPVGEVSDALTVSKLADGMILVARQDYCNRVALSDTIRQFEFIDAKILGIVYNCAIDNSAGYGKKYYKAYEGSYAAAAKKSKRTAAGKTFISKK